MHYGEPNLNEGKDWSEMDLFDLKNSLARNTPVTDADCGAALSTQECQRSRRRCSILHARPRLGKWSGLSD